MLVAAPERWDEACFAVPALRAMVASGLQTGVLCPVEQRPFWETIDGLVVVGFPPKLKAKQIAAGIPGNWEASLAWHDGLVAEAFHAASIPRRLGPDDGKLKKRLTHPLTIFAGPLEHRVRFYLSAVEALGMDVARPEFFAPVGGESTPKPHAVLLCPGSDFGPSHEWPIARWVEIAGKLREAGRRIAVATIGTGRNAGLQLSAALGDGVEIIAAGPLADALSQLTGWELVVAADGSLPHVAGHLGATCVVLFGPNDPAWKRPLGKRHTVVRRHVECAPCLLPKCPLDMRCQLELTVDRVWAAIEPALG